MAEPLRIPTVPIGEAVITTAGQKNLFLCKSIASMASNVIAIYPCACPAPQQGAPHVLVLVAAVGPPRAPPGALVLSCAAPAAYGVAGP